MKIGICRYQIGVTEMTMSKVMGILSANHSDHVVILVHGFQKLINYVRKEKFDLIIMGLGQKGEGLKAIKEIREISPQSRIWVFSKAPEIHLKKAKEFGAEQVFSALNSKERNKFTLAFKKLFV